MNTSDHQTRARAAFHVMIKPFGAACNLRCAYCYYLRKRSLFPASTPACMSDRVLESFTRAYIEAQPLGVSGIEFAWQGGEPTLAGIEFFRRAIELQRRYARPGMRVRNTLQTNGTLLDEVWAAFLAEQDFLVGLSLDGPSDLHDAYRVDGDGQATFEHVVDALRLLRDHGVRFNTLTVLHALNARHPERVYDFLFGTGARHLQFIPLVEKAVDGDAQNRGVEPEAHGTFLAAVFDRWLTRRHVGVVSVRDFDSLLISLLGGPGATCVATRECGRCVALERTGDLYSCDHFVDVDHHLGNVLEDDLVSMIDGPAQTRFGRAKHETLGPACRDCEYVRYCWGGCPKDRRTTEGDALHNHLCAGYRYFFDRALPVLRRMAGGLRAGRSACERRDFGHVMRPAAATGRNELCPCGSGAKYKRCCGR